MRARAGDMRPRREPTGTRKTRQAARRPRGYRGCRVGCAWSMKSRLALSVPWTRRVQPRSAHRKDREHKGRTPGPVSLWFVWVEATPYAFLDAGDVIHGPLAAAAVGFVEGVIRHSLGLQPAAFLGGLALRRLPCPVVDIGRSTIRATRGMSGAICSQRRETEPLKRRQKRPWERARSPVRSCRWRGWRGVRGRVVR